MQMRYYVLVGKRVIASDGRKVGRIADLVAKAEGDKLCVTAMLVGPSALIRRITFNRSRLFQVASPLKIPWHLVDRINEKVYLRIPCAEVEPIEECEAVPATSEHAAMREPGR